MKPKMVKRSELGLGDVINLGGFETDYCSSTVYRIDKGMIHLVRPYIHTGDCVYSGNSLIHYLGYEEYSIEVNDSEVLLLRKNMTPLK